MGKIYKDTNDAELLFMVNEESEDAKDILYKKYYYIIEQAMKRYAKIIAKSGTEYKDIYQEAMLGFADALDKYNDNKETQLPTFITLCVKRRLSNLLRASTNVKSKFNKDILSIDYDYENYDKVEEWKRQNFDKPVDSPDRPRIKQRNLVQFIEGKTDRKSVV